MSTRVHELAKELGLKSAELLERIQAWGLDVKASNFASLDPATVDRIRELNASPKSEHAPAPRSTTESPSSPPARPASPASPPQASSSGASAAATAQARSTAPQATKPTSSMPVNPTHPRASRRLRRAGGGTGSGTRQQPVACGAARRSRDHRRRFTRLLRRVQRAPSRPQGHGRLRALRPWLVMVDSPARVQAAARSRRIHRIVGQARDRDRLRHLRATRSELRPGSPGSGSAPSQGGFQPLKPGDYMSSAGIRTMTPRVSPAPPASSASRRPADGSGDGGRRDSGGAGQRKGPPLPQVAAASAPRPVMSPRSQAPSPAPKTQRPDKSMTREELLAMMRSGQLSNLQSPGGGAGMPGGGPRGGHPQRPGSPPGAPRPGGPGAPGGPPRGAGRRSPRLAPSHRRHRSPTRKRNARQRPAGWGQQPIVQAAAPGAASVPASAGSRLRSPSRRFWSTTTTRAAPVRAIERAATSEWLSHRREKHTSRLSLRSTFEASPKPSASRHKTCCGSS